MNPSDDELARAIHEEIAAAAVAARRFAIRNYFLAYAVSGVIVLASIGSGITVAIAEIPKWFTASLAALPAVMLTASTVFRFEQKSAWFWKKTKALDSLVRKIRYESMGTVEASQAFSRIEEDLESEWISFGTVGRSQD